MDQSAELLGLDATVLICTYNRADSLAETLDSLARSRTNGLRWHVVVVDNNSNDHTRHVVTSRADRYPVALRYIFEKQQGKSIALNTGIAVTDAPIVVFTDDDVRVKGAWLEAACRVLLADSSIDYTGGPVEPIWHRPCPAWLEATESDLLGTLSILDCGPDAFEFESRKCEPLGANLAIRRSLIERIGGFDPRLGRLGTSLLGQELDEFFCRSRAAGARGMYVPEMLLQHHVPAPRLTREYFRRWWFWKGISQSRLDQLHPVTEQGVDLTQVRKLAGIPRSMLTSAARDAGGWIASLASWDQADRTRHEMMLCFFAGYVRETRAATAAPAADTVSHPLAP